MSDLLNIEVNGVALQAPKGAMIIQVTDGAGITVPRFCYHRKLSVAANCRMCLVDVEKMPKPVPACATPVMDGMKVQTRSQRALDAQRGVMEFLLINHPLDCPICDEGGECELQDTALGFGKVESRYTEDKRVVKGKNLGPLIATEMTRCIHCTRCVRFGQEVAGLMELGGTGRGEHLTIGTYIESGVESELSGNMIDLCPVGALTSKPFRFTARSWELQKSPAISPHDCVGSHLEIHAVGDRVKRVLPRENEAINEIWLADRDRFSYLGLNAEDRLLQPVLKTAGAWRQVSWEQALRTLADKLSGAGDDLQALLSASLTTEEYYLFQKLLRGLGSSHIDHRLRQVDFSNQDSLPLYPSIPSISGLGQVTAGLLIGSNLRKDQPLLNSRLLQAVKAGALVWSLSSYRYEFNYPLAGQVSVAPEGLVLELAKVCQALSPAFSEQQPGAFPNLIPDQRHQQMADQLRNAKNAVVLLGNQAQCSPHYATLRLLAKWIAELSGARLLETSVGGNGVGAWMAGAIPHRGPAGTKVTPGRDVDAMLRHPASVLLLAGVEPGRDCYNPQAAASAARQAGFTAALTWFDSVELRDCADLLLPMAAFAETSGTYANAEGILQSFPAAVSPPGEARPAWKILRVLGNLLGLEGFSYQRSEEVLAQLQEQLAAAGDFVPSPAGKLVLVKSTEGLVRIGDVPIYAVDPIVRRSPALQARADAPAVMAHLNAGEAERFGIREGDVVTVSQGGNKLQMPVAIDARVPDGCCYLPVGIPGVEALGGAYDLLQVSAS